MLSENSLTNYSSGNVHLASDQQANQGSSSSATNFRQLIDQTKRKFRVDDTVVRNQNRTSANDLADSKLKIALIKSDQSQIKEIANYQ